MMRPPCFSPSDPRLMNTDTTPNGSSDQASHHRRSREEVEALAKNFTATPTVEAPPPNPRVRLAMMGGAAAVIVLILAVVLWPKGRSDAERAQAEANRAAAAAEAEQYRQRFEAERERKRAEVAAGKEYLERMAAADAAALKDLSETAGALAERAARAPVAAASDQPPTPRDRTAAAKPAPTPTPAPSQPAQTTASTAPAKAAPAPATAAPQPAAATPQPAAAQAPAKTEPTQVAQADKSECTIHVSELSKSGKLTYADVKRMKGTRLDEETGSVFTPPVQTAGRTVVFEVFPNGCVQLVRSSLGGR